jgi:hypothetical protein
LLTGARHEPKGSAPFQSIKGVDNLVFIENGYQPVHRARSVARAECNVFPKDAPGILDGRQYDVMIRGVHGTHLLSGTQFDRTSIVLFAFGLAYSELEHLPDDSQYQDHRMA